MTYYRVQIIHPDGSRELKQVWGNGATNAHWNATQLHPGAQVSVLQSLEEHEVDDDL